MQVANFLCNGNYAVSGSSKACDVVEQIAKPDFKARMTVRLAVAGAFHTDFMEAAVDKVRLYYSAMLAGARVSSVITGCVTLSSNVLDGVSLLSTVASSCAFRIKEVRNLCMVAPVKLVQTPVVVNGARGVLVCERVVRAQHDLFVDEIPHPPHHLHTHHGVPHVHERCIKSQKLCSLDFLTEIFAIQCFVTQTCNGNERLCLPRSLLTLFTRLPGKLQKSDEVFLSQMCFGSGVVGSDGRGRSLLKTCDIVTIACALRWKLSHSQSIVLISFTQRGSLKCVCQIGTLFLREHCVVFFNNELLSMFVFVFVFT